MGGGICFAGLLGVTTVHQNRSVHCTLYGRCEHCCLHNWKLNGRTCVVAFIAFHNQWRLSASTYTVLRLSYVWLKWLVVRCRYYCGHNFEPHS
jgi:hypothetical protein